VRAFHRLDEIPVHRIPEGTLQLLSGEQSMVFWLEVDAGSHIARHSHPNEQITWLLEGRFDIQIGDDPARSCGSGSVLLIPGNTLHEAWYRENAGSSNSSARRGSICFQPPPAIHMGLLKPEQR
jgi:quercetin dioxygenase-like cupin family protein